MPADQDTRIQINSLCSGWVDAMEAHRAGSSSRRCHLGDQVSMAES